MVVDMGDKNFIKGYTIIDNRLLEALQKARLNGTQSRIVFCILRATYGFNKKEFEMSLTFIANATGIEKTRISKDLKELIDRNIVKVYKQSTFSTPKSIGINKNFNQWELAKLTTVGENVYTPVGEIANTTVGETANQKIHNKNTYNKIHILCTPTVHEYDDSFESFWKLYPKKVAKIRCYKYFQEANLYEEIEAIIKGLDYLIKVDYSKKERKFIPDPITFLKDERWKDFKEEPVKKKVVLGRY